MPEVTDLQRVAQYVKSDKTAPSDVYNAACRLLDTHAPESPAPVKHVGGRANAEDCPACTGDVPYPWICPGEATESHGDGQTGAPATPETHEAHGGSQ